MKEVTLNTIKDYPSDVLKDILPAQIISEAGSIDGCLTKFSLSPLNKFYENSDYFVDPSCNQFVHFTTLDKAKEILSTNKLRLYDLNFADDPHEIVFTAKSVNLNSDIDLSRLKSLLYSISFCSYPLTEEDEHNMWRLYGNDGSGIGLVFSFNNDCRRWCNFHLSRIYYQTPDKIKGALIRHSEYFKKLNDGGYYNTIDEQNWVYNILQLFAFHKHSIYGTEKEFRLLYKYDPWDDKQRIYTLNRRNQLSSYIELNLAQLEKGSFQLNKSQINLPLLKIDKLIFGYRYSGEQVESFKEIVRDMYVHNRNNYSTIRPHIEITSLKENYFI